MGNHNDISINMYSDGSGIVSKSENWVLWLNIVLLFPLVILKNHQIWQQLKKINRKSIVPTCLKPIFPWHFKNLGLRCPITYYPRHITTILSSLLDNAPNYLVGCVIQKRYHVAASIHQVSFDEHQLISHTKDF